MKFGKPLAIGALVLLALTGCAGGSSEGNSKTNPILTSGEDWSERYVKVNQNVYLCVLENEGYTGETLDCDWGRPNPSAMPKNIVPLVAGTSEHWKVQYIKVSSGQILTCLIHDDGDTTRDCSWVE